MRNLLVIIGLTLVLTGCTSLCGGVFSDLLWLPSSVEKQGDKIKPVN